MRAASNRISGSAADSLRPQTPRPVELTDGTSGLDPPDRIGECQGAGPGDDGEHAEAE